MALHGTSRTRYALSAFLGIFLAASANAQDVAVTLQRSELANEGPVLFRLTIPRALFEQWGSTNEDALSGRPVRFVILRTLYPSFSPQSAPSQRGLPRADGLRIIIAPIGIRHGGRSDTGRFRLDLNLRGVNRLVPQGEPLGTAMVQRYLTVDGKTEAFSFRSEDGFTVYASCPLLLAFCRAWRTWKTDYGVDYSFGIGLRDQVVTIDRGVTDLLSTFNPTIEVSRK